MGGQNGGEGGQKDQEQRLFIQRDGGGIAQWHIRTSHPAAPGSNLGIGTPFFKKNPHYSSR